MLLVLPPVGFVVYQIRRVGYYAIDAHILRNHLPNTVKAIHIVNAVAVKYHKIPPPRQRAAANTGIIKSVVIRLSVCIVASVCRFR